MTLQNELDEKDKLLNEILDQRFAQVQTSKLDQRLEQAHTQVHELERKQAQARANLQVQVHAS